MKTKTFDCVAMKRAGAAEVYRKTRGMTRRQKLEFWRLASDALQERQLAARARQQEHLAQKK
jgi:hypothetical protein